MLNRHFKSECLNTIAVYIISWFGLFFKICYYFLSSVHELFIILYTPPIIQHLLFVFISLFLSHHKISHLYFFFFFYFFSKCWITYLVSIKPLSLFFLKVNLFSLWGLDAILSTGCVVTLPYDYLSYDWWETLWSL